MHCVRRVCASRHSSGTQSILHPRSYYTFGTILPPIIEQSCARDLHFLFPYYYFIIMMFERFVKCNMYLSILCVFNDTLHQSRIYPAYIPHISGTHPGCIRHTSGIHPAHNPGCIRHISGIYPAPNPFYIRGHIIPSVRSYRRL